MRDFLIRVVISAVAIAITASLLPGVHVVNNDIGTLLILGVVFGLVNGLIKPIISLLTCPLVFLTLGLFILVINGAMLMLTAAISDGRLVIDHFGWAIGGGIIMGIVGVVMEWAFGVNDAKNRR
jgi:putative membrane protein